LLSLCIPTFNRGRYLASLLESLVLQMAAFPHPYELVISDNACTDDTPAVVQRFLDKLPIRYIRHPEGIGCYPNVIFVMTQTYRDRARLIAEQVFQPSRGGIVIEDDVWIGANCVLLDGTVLRRGCVIGAGSLVRGEVAANTVNAGNPLVRLGERQ
jgi:glycosyltransferase involved in cell wall biosynthesis